MSYTIVYKIVWKRAVSDLYSIGDHVEESEITGFGSRAEAAVVLAGLVRRQRFISAKIVLDPVLTEDDEQR